MASPGRDRARWHVATTSLVLAAGLAGCLGPNPSPTPTSPPIETTPAPSPTLAQPTTTPIAPTPTATPAGPPTAMSWYPVNILPDDPSYGGQTGMTAVTPTWFGYLAVGYGPAGGRTWWSSDGGQTWNEALYPEPALRLAQLRAVAASPSLIVAAGTINGLTGTAPGLWTSRDGVAWTKVDLGPEAGTGYMSGVTWTGSEFIAVGRGASNDQSAKVWRSPDGKAWTTQDLGDADPLGIVNGPAGIFVWGTQFEGPSPTAAWSIGTPGTAPAPFGIDQVLTNVIATPAGFLGLAPGATSGYTAFRSADGHAWTQAGSFDLSTVGGFTTRPDGTVVVAGTTDNQVQEVVESRDGAAWQQDPWTTKPEAQASIAALAASSDVIVGVGATAGNRVGAWLALGPDAGSPLDLQRDPVYTGCPGGTTVASPTLLLSDLFRLSDAKRVACFGATTIHVRGYLATPDGLRGTCGPETVTPTWLTGGCPSYPMGWLESLATSFGAATTLEVFASGASADALAQGQWVDIRGHFDDPASTTCRRVDTSTGQLAEPAKTTIAFCRSHFVATLVTRSSAPAQATANADPAVALLKLDPSYQVAPDSSGWDNLALPAATTWGFRDVTSPAGLKVLVTVFRAPTLSDVPGIAATLRQSHGPTTTQVIGGVSVAFSGSNEGAVFAIGSRVYDVSIDQESSGGGMTELVSAIIAAG